MTIFHVEIPRLHRIRCRPAVCCKISRSEYADEKTHRTASFLCPIAGSILRIRPDSGNLSHSDIKDFPCLSVRAVYDSLVRRCRLGVRNSF